jgi:hypothetical protein
MIKIHPNIIIGNPNELHGLLNSVTYIINCSINLNNLINHPNYINLNIDKFSWESFYTLNELYKFINGKIIYGNNFFLLCDTGINNSLVVGIFILMNIYKAKYNDIYYQLAYTNKINSYEYYSGLVNFEPNILANDMMDLSDL